MSDSIENKDNKIICSEINEIELKFLNNYLFCEKNNFFNLSIMYFNSFEKENKEQLDKYIDDIKKSIVDNYIDENIFFEFLRKNMINYNETIPLKTFDFYIDNINEVMVNLMRSKEVEYKEFLVDILKKSCNSSYSYLIDNYIMDELIDNVTIFINDKLEIFLDYINEKISNEFLYLNFLLNKTGNLGYSTKLSLKNIFNFFKEKIIESINYKIENEIFFYIDIFYRENKNNFAKNLINYYIQENEYNINIYKLRSLLSELIYNESFNKSIDNISYIHIKYITNEIKTKIKTILDDKFYKVNFISNNYSIVIENILINKTTIELNEEMLPIYDLIKDFNLIIKNQNNYFNFIVGERPFDLINIFIEEDLRPPLVLIKEKYSFIEEKIIEFISEKADNFPDCYSMVRDNYPNSSIEDIHDYLNEINETFF